MVQPSRESLGGSHLECCPRAAIASLAAITAMKK
jgi:hypothetical protein